MQSILLLSTGGTIASKLGGHGLQPGMQSGDLLGFLDGISGDVRFDHLDLLQLDSSNIQPEQWQLIAREVYNQLGSYDGIIITHGTDTMAYTSSALSFMLQNLGKPVVLTGSQLPIDNPLSDARTNLYTAISAVRHNIRGVTVAFDRKILNGTRAVKVSTMGFNAFDSINSACMGRIYADGMRVFSGQTGEIDPSGPAILEDQLCTDVFLLKVLPGTKPELFDVLANLGYRGMIVEAFGTGGLHYIHRDLLQALQALTKRGIAVVVCSQCLYERSDLSVYEVGQRMLAGGVIPGRDMTTEAAATKLMWALGKTENLEEIARMFSTSYVGEVVV